MWAVMLSPLFGALGTALAIRRLDMIQGEAIAWKYGAQGVRRALEMAAGIPRLACTLRLDRALGR